MKACLFFIPLAAAVLVSCGKEPVGDNPSGEEGGLIYVEKGVSIMAGAETDSRVSFELLGDEGSYTGTRMSWEVGDRIKLLYGGRVRNFVNTVAGRWATFRPVSDSDVLGRDEFDPDDPQPMLAYYNVTSVATADGTATFTIPSEQTEGEVSNKLPLYASLAEAVLVDNQIVLLFRPMASVLDFKLSAALRLKDGEGDQVLSYDGFNYKLTKVVFEPESGASGWTVGICTFDPSDGSVTPDDDDNLSAITFNFADTTDIASTEGAHVRIIIGECRLNESGATMEWYKHASAPNYVKSIWQSKDIDLTGGHKYMYQGINPKAVGLYDYDDYKTMFYNYRYSQNAQYITLCDDERNVVLTGDIDMGDGFIYYNAALNWGFDGRNHCFYNFDVTDYSKPGFFTNIAAGLKNVSFGNSDDYPAYPAVFDITDAGNYTHYGPVLDCSSGTISNVNSDVDYTLTVTHASSSRFLGGVLGRMRNGDLDGCSFSGSLSMETDNETTHTNTLHMGGIAARIIPDDSSNHYVTACSTGSAATISADLEAANPLYCGGIVGVCQAKCTFSGCSNAATITCSNAPGSFETSNKMVVAGIVSSLSSNKDILISNSINLGQISTIATSNVNTAESAGIIGELNGGNTVQNCGSAADLSASGAVNNYASWYANWVSGTVVSGKVLSGISLNGTSVGSSNYNTKNIWSESNVQGTLSLASTLSEIEALLNE